MNFGFIDVKILFAATATDFEFPQLRNLRKLAVAQITMVVTSELYSVVSVRLETKFSKYLNWDCLAKTGN